MCLTSSSHIAKIQCRNGAFSKNKVSEIANVNRNTAVDDSFLPCRSKIIKVSILPISPTEIMIGGTIFHNLSAAMRVAPGGGGPVKPGGGIQGGPCGCLIFCPCSVSDIPLRVVLENILNVQYISI
jgi:hypothetical protein